MHKLQFLLLSLIILGCNAPQPDIPLSYTLDLKNDTMHVSMTYNPRHSDSTIFQYGNTFFGGMNDQLKSLINLQTSNSYQVDSTKYQITIFHQPGETISLNYDIIDTHLAEHRVVGEMFRTIITPDYYFSLSNTTLLQPIIADSLKNDLLMSVQLPENPPFPIHYSFTTDAKPGGKILTTWKEGLEGLIIGASDLHVEKRTSGNMTNYLVLRVGENEAHNLNRMLDFFDRYMPAMDEFWGIPAGTHYSLIASPFVDIDYHKISGTAFQNGFHVKYSGDTLLADQEVMTVVAHEIMHRYIGAGTVSMGEQHQWFDEGFTDYTTQYLLAQCGLISSQDFESNIRKAYQELAQNPHRNLPNSEVMKHFWESKDYELLPYRRGAIFAAFLQHQMEKVNGKDRFQALMRALKELGNLKGSLVPEDLIEAAKPYLEEQELTIALNEYIFNGKMIKESLIFD